MTEPEGRRRWFHPRRADLWAVIATAIFVSQIAVTLQGGQADPTLTGAALALAVGVPIFTRVDEARNGKD